MKRRAVSYSLPTREPDPNPFWATHMFTLLVITSPSGTVSYSWVFLERLFDSALFELRVRSVR